MTPKFFGESDIKLGLATEYDNFNRYGIKPTIRPIKKSNKKLISVNVAKAQKTRRSKVKSKRRLEEKIKKGKPKL